MTEHHTSRRAKALKKDTARQQKRRDRLKEAGAPTTHVLNRAIAEGLLDCLAVELAKGLTLKSIEVSAQSVLIRARETLTKGNSAITRYQPSEVTKALRGRIARARGRSAVLPR